MYGNHHGTPLHLIFTTRELPTWHNYELELAMDSLCDSEEAGIDRTDRHQSDHYPYALGHSTTGLPGKSDKVFDI